MKTKYFILFFVAVINLVKSAQAADPEKDGTKSTLRYSNVEYRPFSECQKALETFSYRLKCEDKEYLTSASKFCKDSKESSYYVPVEEIVCAKKSSAVFSSDEPCPAGYSDKYKPISPPYDANKKRLCIALNAVNAFSIPSKETCPKGFYAERDSTNATNNLCVRDQRKKRVGSKWVCRSVDKPKEVDNTVEEEVICLYDVVESSFKIKCDKNKSLSDCITQKLNSSANTDDPDSEAIK